jgi:thymidine phosphorylase
METPLGATIGNALETREAIEILHGNGPADLLECTLALGVEMLRLGGVAQTDDEARRALSRAIADGSGARTFERMIAAQGGDPGVVGDLARLPRTAQRVAVTAQRAGIIGAIDALELGLASVAMGAGRTRADQSVDPSVGIELSCKPGDAIEAGAPLCWLHVHDARDAERHRTRVASAFAIASGPVAASPLVLDVVRA